MASPRFKSGRWYVRFRDGRGKRVERRTPFTKDERRRAEKYGRELEEQAYRERDGLERAAEKMPLKELYARFEPVLRKKRSWKSLQGRWRHILGALGERPIHLITPADIETMLANAAPLYRAERKTQQRELSPQTREHLRVAMAAAYTFAIRKLRVFKGENPARIAERPTMNTPRIKFLDPVSMDMLLERGVPRQWQGVFACGAFTGMRKGEILGLQLGDIDPARHLIWVSRSYDQQTTKGNKGRMVGISPALMPYLREAMARAVGLRSKWLFPDDSGEMRTPDTKLTDVMRRALKRAGIEAPDGFSFKDLRSTFATHLAEATGDLQVVQKQLGHASSSTTSKHYAFARGQHLAEQVAKLPYGKPQAHSLPPSVLEAVPFEPKSHKPS